MDFTAHITGLGVDHSDGSFTITYDICDLAERIIASHSQAFPAGTERGTVDEAVRNYVRDVVPLLIEQPPIEIGDTITPE